MGVSMETSVRTFTTKQLIVILLTKPEVYTSPTATNPTIAYIRRGLKIYFNKTVSTKQTRRLLAELESEGVLMREITAWQPASGQPQDQASHYTIIDFYKAFQDVSDPSDESRKHKRRKKRIKITLFR